MQTKRIYLRNEDLLREIHESKKTFSSYLEPQYSDYDVIVEDIQDITEELINRTLQDKVDRINKAERRKLMATGLTRHKLEKAHQKITLEDLDPEELVFRLMTFDHIPLEPGRIKNPKKTADHHVRLTFPPFKHFTRKKTGELVEVGRSHWVGGFENGHFEVHKGQINRKLAQMIMLLVNRYGTRFNWRGYSYNEEMRGEAITQLCQVALQFNEARSSNPFAFFTVVASNAFTRVLNNEKKTQNIRDDLMEEAGFTPSNTRQRANEVEKESKR